MLRGTAVYAEAVENSGSQSRLQTALTAHTTDGRLGLHIKASGPCMNSTSAKLFLDLPTMSRVFAAPSPSTLQCLRYLRIFY